MKYRQVLPRSLMIPALMLALPGVTHAAAGYVAVNNLKLPVIEVVGNGVEYTGIKPAIGGGWQADLSIDTSGGARIKSWQVWPHVEGGIGLPEIDLSEYAASQSYAFGNRPKSVNKTVGQLFPVAAIAEHAVARCNLNRMQLGAQGHSAADIFGQSHVLDFSDLRFRFDLDLTIGNTNIFMEGGQHPYQVICLAHDATPKVPTAGAMASAFQVTGAALSISPGHKLQSACPVELDFNGTIHTAGTVPTTVQYRFEWPTGERSTIFSAHVANPAEGVQVSHKMQIPLPSAATPAPNPQGGGGPAPGGFAVAQQPPPPPAQPTLVAKPESDGPELKAPTLPANEHRNDVRLVVFSHGNVTSDPASYHIVCEPRPGTGIGGPAGMAVPDRGGAPADPERSVLIGTVPSPDSGPPPARESDEVGQFGEPVKVPGREPVRPQRGETADGLLAPTESERPPAR
jgi:hypothetical protein